MPVLFWKSHTLNIFTFQSCTLKIVTFGIRSEYIQCTEQKQSGVNVFRVVRECYFPLDKGNSYSFSLFYSEIELRNEEKFKKMVTFLPNIA